MERWRLDLLEKLNGVKPGEMTVMMAGRRAGKSMMSSSAFKRLFDDIYSQPISDILLAEGTVYGSRYYTAEPIGGSWPEMEAWCYQTFGDDSKPIWGESTTPKPAQRWYKNNRKFWFRNEADRTLFVLKWR